MSPASLRAQLIDFGLMAIAFAIWLGGTMWVLTPLVAASREDRLVWRLVAAGIDHQPPKRSDVAQLNAIAPNAAWSHLFAAELAIHDRNHAEAIRRFEMLPNDHGNWELIRHMSLARRYQIVGQLTAAERHYRSAIALAPDQIEAYFRLGHLLQIEGRSWEAAPLFFSQIMRGKCRGDELLGASGTERFFRADDLIENAALAADPADPLIQVGIGRREFYANNTDVAESLFRDIVSQRSQLGEAQGRWGRIIVDRGDLAEFLAWRGSLPDDARNHPEVWYVQGLKARQLEQIEGAARCYLEALALDPNHLGANTNLAGCLQQLGKSEVAAEFRKRAEKLSELDSLLNLVRESSDRELIGRIAALEADLGRYWEAAGWCYVLTQYPGEQDVPTRQLRQWLKLARRSPEANAPEKLPAKGLDRRAFPPPRWPQRSFSPVPAQANALNDVAWRFTDDAHRLGVDVTYFEGTREDNRLAHIFNVMGGGLGSLDYDGDGWPDLYVAQANNWRDSSPQPQWHDQLFRNSSGDAFDDVTRLAGLGDCQFSHGVTVGDFDQDGWPDLYIGNKGVNRLYHNHGDGTFSDITTSAGVAGNDWTTSSVFADFNQDGLPDLYVLNYTLIDETARKECGTAAVRKACTPDVLTSADDRLYLNLGDGQFRDISRAAGLSSPDGKGLGVVAWDFAGEGRMGLFIANDTTPNLLLINKGNSPEGIPQFVDEAVVRGIAYDSNGNAQASMGVAAGDVTGDGRIDLCMTDFFGSGIGLYSQREDGFYDDVTRRRGLREPSLMMLGFGCHFGDFDVDGWDDLLVTNGHVDQQSSKGTPDRMPAQLFHNQGGERFMEVPGPRLGPFFEQGHLGRGLALWDWNRDGRTDAAISHLHSPVAILTNRTIPSGKPLVVRLISHTGCREPTGATVKLLNSSIPQVRMLTAGDGFLVTNERRLMFSIVPTVSTVDLEVKWPDGQIQKVLGVEVNTEILLIQSKAVPLVLRSGLL